MSLTRFSRVQTNTLPRRSRGNEGLVCRSDQHSCGLIAEAAQLAAPSITSSSFSMKSAKNWGKDKPIWSQKPEYLAKIYTSFSLKKMVPLILQDHSPTSLLASPMKSLISPVFAKQGVQMQPRHAKKHIFPLRKSSMFTPLHPDLYHG